MTFLFFASGDFLHFLLLKCLVLWEMIMLRVHIAVFLILICNFLLIQNTKVSNCV